MKTILVLDVAADSGGALTVLEEYYDRLRQDTQNQYLFCVSLPHFADTDTLHVRRFPWVKRSWLHRLWFEQVTVKRLIRREKPDEVLSLQNTTVRGAHCPQTVYLHQPLPFCGIRFSLWRQPKFWVYQHLIGRRIYASLREAHEVIVQTQWMKEAACEKAGISPEKVSLQPPQVNCVPAGRFSNEKWQRTFFYPASAYSYKNHETLFRAMELLDEQGVGDFTVRLTLTQEQLPCLSRFPRAAAHTQLCGQLPREAVMAAYTESVLVFPSYIETFGLPLLEARMSDSPIVASDTPFSREILAGYATVSYFDPFDPAALAAGMRAAMEGNV